MITNKINKMIINIQSKKEKLYITCKGLQEAKNIKK